MIRGKDKERLAKLNSAIFNGIPTAHVVEIKLRRDTSDKTDIISKYQINLDFKNAIVSRGIDIVDDITDDEYKKLFRTSCIFDTWKSITDEVEYVSDLSYSVFDVGSTVIGSSNPRSSISHIEEDGSGLYIVNTSVQINLSMTEDMMKNYGANSGLIKRKFEQTINFPVTVKRLLVIYPNNQSLPILFAYDKDDFDINNILDNENKDYVFTSFAENFTYNDEVVFFTPKSLIVLDSNFYKVKSMLETQDENELEEEVKENEKVVYNYNSEYITGNFGKDGGDARYYLLGKESKYMIYNNILNYGINVFSFRDEIKEFIDVGNDDWDDISKNQLKSLLAYKILYNYLSPYPLPKVYAVKDKFGSNINTYHYYLPESMSNMERVISIYNNEFVIVREYEKSRFDNTEQCYFSIVKLAESGAIEVIINSKIIYSRDEEYYTLKYETMVSNKFNINGEIKMARAATISNSIKDNHMIKSFDYHSPDLENFTLQKFCIQGNHVNLITKFDSLLYNANNLDEVIVRNYLGLPINHHHIMI